MTYDEAKKLYPTGTIILFRVGDNYESFYEDAHTLVKVLELTLTVGVEIPTVIFPHTKIEEYLYKLLRSGHKYRVAIMDQTERTTNGR